MATKLRKTDPVVSSLADAINDLKAFVVAEQRLLRADLVSIAADASGFATPAVLDLGPHNDVAEYQVLADDPDDGEDDDGLAGALEVTNELLALYAVHMADTLAHKVTGVALASYAPATTLAEAITRANDIKSKYNTHIASTTYHYTADTTNAISASNATILSDLITLLIELKADFNAHVTFGAACKSIRLEPA